MTFSTIALTNDRVVVKGTDVHGTAGETIVDGSQWAELNARKEFSSAEADFEAAVEEFFAPLTEAADNLASKLNRPTDSVDFIVLQEEQEGQAHVPAQLIRLSKDSQILRLIDEGKTDRLMWVAGELEVVAAAAVGQGVLPVTGVVDEDVAVSDS